MYYNTILGFARGSQFVAGQAMISMDSVKGTRGEEETKQQTIVALTNQTTLQDAQCKDQNAEMKGHFGHNF